jgi:hypothetical protein
MNSHSYRQTSRQLLQGGQSAKAVWRMQDPCQFAVGPISAPDEAQKTGGSQEGLPLASRHTSHDLITGIAAGHKSEQWARLDDAVWSCSVAKYEQLHDASAGCNSIPGRLLTCRTSCAPHGLLITTTTALTDKSNCIWNATLRKLTADVPKRTVSPQRETNFSFGVLWCDERVGVKLSQSYLPSRPRS